MAVHLTKNPVQTYSRNAERIGEQVAKSKSDPQLIEEMVKAVRSQAKDISEYMISKSGERQLRKGSFRRIR